MTKKYKQEGFDDSFYKLANEVAYAIKRNKNPAYEGLKSTEVQKLQVEELLDAEKKFKENILKYRQSTEIYKKFLQKVCIENHNILSARPYFRETATAFSKSITPAIKDNSIESLKTFDINYQLIKFIRDSWLGPFPKRAEALYQRVHAARTLLIEDNMPLAINRAKLFYRRTPKSHLTLMDLIGICGMGLAAGIDKWCGSYTPIFRSVCIGRMVGYMIDSYSETMLHFYPSDKRILYKANSIRGRQGIEDIEELTKAVNESFKKDALEGKSVPKKDVEVGELSELMNAASIISADKTISSDDDKNFTIYDFTPDPDQDIENSYIQREATNRMLIHAARLPLLHKKVLRLKGVKI
jgi:DNA-directed RNA polymerase specialized sigma subunit